MAYASGSPVVFVGTGQKYTHLQTLRVRTNSLRTFLPFSHSYSTLQVKAVVQAILDG